MAQFSRFSSRKEDILRTRTLSFISGHKTVANGEAHQQTKSVTPAAKQHDWKPRPLLIWAPPLDAHRFLRHPLLLIGSRRLVFLSILSPRFSTFILFFSVFTADRSSRYGTLFFSYLSRVMLGIGRIKALRVSAAAM